MAERGRPRKIPTLPLGLRLKQPVKVSSSETKGFKLGIIYDKCKWDDGVIVWLTGDSVPGESRVTVCINPERGDTIEGIEIEAGTDSKASL